MIVTLIITIKYLNLHHLSSNIINIIRRIPDAICVFLVGQMNSPSIVVRGDRSSAAWVGWQGHVIICANFLDFLT